MKKIILSMIALTATAVSLNAQISQGTMMLGGNMGISSSGSTTKVGGTSSDGPSTTNLYFSPFFGYFLADNLAVGVGLSLTSEKTVSYPGLNTEQTVTTKLNGINVGARYYTFFTDNFGVFGQLLIGPEFGTRKTEMKDIPSGTTVSTETKLSGFNAMINPALVFFPNNKFGLEASFANLSFSSSKEKSDGTPTVETSETNFDLSVNTMLNFGFFWYFNR